MPEEERLMPLITPESRRPVKVRAPMTADPTAGTDLRPRLPITPIPGMPTGTTFAEDLDELPCSDAPNAPNVAN